MSGENTHINKPQGGASIEVDASGEINLADDAVINIGTGNDVTAKWDGTNFYIGTGLPTTDPEIDGMLWTNSGALTVSLGN